MNIFQILTLLFILLSIMGVVKDVRGNGFKPFSTTLWLVIWISGAVVIIDPNVSFIISDTLGIGRGADAVIYLSVIVLFYIIYKMYLKIEKINKKIKDISTKIALKNDASKAK